MNTFIKTLFADSYELFLHETLDAFWSECTNFNNNIDTFDSNEFIYISKDIHDGNSNTWHQKYSLPCTKVFGFFIFMNKFKIYWDRIFRVFMG